MSVITISRQVGSGAEEIARLVCDRLSYSYFDKTFLVQEALETGLSEAEIVELSEENYRVKTFLENLFTPGARPVMSVPVSHKDEKSGVEKKYTRHLDELDCIDTIRLVINAAYKRGSIVIMGRGGQVILQKRPDVLHVLLVAPMHLRVKRLMAEQGYDAQGAHDFIQERDRATREYLERFFKARWDDPTLYNLTIDTGECSILAAANMIVQAAQRLTEREVAV